MKVFGSTPIPDGAPKSSSSKPALENLSQYSNNVSVDQTNAQVEVPSSPTTTSNLVGYFPDSGFFGYTYNDSDNEMSDEEKLVYERPTLGMQADQHSSSKVRQHSYLKVEDAKRSALGGKRARRKSQPGPETDERAQARAFAEKKAYWREHYRPTELIRDTARGPRVAGEKPPPERVGMPRDRKAWKVRASDRRFSLPRAGIGYVIAAGLTVGAIVLGPVTLGGSLMVGGAVAAALGGTLWGRYGAAKPQKAHLDAALRRLTDLDVRYTSAQAQTLARVTDAQWRELLHVPKAMIADRADRQKVRTTLVHTLALHGFEYAEQNKERVMRAVITAQIERGNFDLEEGLEDDHALDLPSVVAIDQRLRDLHRGRVDKQTGWSQAFLEDVPDQLRTGPTEWDENTADGVGAAPLRVWLHPGPETAARLSDNRFEFGTVLLGQKTPDGLNPAHPSMHLEAFVGPDNNDRKVARGLSHYINHAPLDVLWPRSNLGDGDRQPLIDVLEDEDNPGNYLLRYQVDPADQDDTGRSMAISVRREDLAAGNGRFTWFDPPKRNMDDDPLDLLSVAMHSSFRRGALTNDDMQARPAQHSRRPTLQTWVSSVRQRRLTGQGRSNRSAASQRQQPPRLQRAATTRHAPNQKPVLKQQSVPDQRSMRTPQLPPTQTSIPESPDEDGDDQ
jgi:hypothetical protein